MTQSRPTLNKINIPVRDMDATIAFYRRLGLEITADAGAYRVNVQLSNGMELDFDSVSFVPQWDSGWSGSTGGNSVLGFSVATRERVDELYADLVTAGYQGHQPPYDAFWGARYAMVNDPDGNAVGLMSPIEKEREFWPPKLPPTA